MLRDRYAGWEKIGEGASAVVFRAHDTQTDSPVAIKVLKPHLQADPVSIERFRREVQITRELGHPGVVSIYDLVQEEGKLHLIMEYLTGDNLKDFIRLRHPVPVPESLSVLRQLLDVLGACHAKNIVHRDLKPQNIIVDGPRVKVLDFGVARMATLSDLTQTGAAIGSPEYMAPELFAANTYDPRTDLYALGVVAFELLAGRLPFTGDSIAELYEKHRREDVPELIKIRADVPEWLQQLIGRLMAKQSFERYATAEEVLTDIDAKRVVAREIAPLPRRECVHCGHQTLEAVSVCLHCGGDALAASGSGDFEVSCLPEEDDARIEKFVHEVFDRHARVDRKGRTLLWSGLDNRSAHLLRDSAARHGLTLSVTQRTAETELKQATGAGCVMFLACAGLPLFGMYFGAPNIFAFFNLVLWAVLLGAAWRRTRKWETKPVLDHRSTDLTVKLDNTWYEPFLENLKPKRTDSMRLLVSLMAEKYVLMAGAVHPTSDDLDRQLQRILCSVAGLAEVVSDIDQALQQPRIVQQAQAYFETLRKLELAGNEAERNRLRSVLATLEGRVRGRMALEEKQGDLLRRLIAHQALFNRTAAQVLVAHSAVDDATREEIASSAAAVNQLAIISKEVTRELRRFA